MESIIKYEFGNLLDMLDKFDAVLQGCNCFHVMGGGIARQFAERYPEVYAADREQTVRGDVSKLGTYSKACVGNTDVLNCYTQYHYDSTRPQFRYGAFVKVLERVKDEYHGKRIAMPMIGAGLAGGDWDTIASIISEVLDGEDVTVVVLKPNQ
jgi:O-acetyl-ADP-ribose deacetylase (regulator of RNase III)